MVGLNESLLALVLGSVRVGALLYVLPFAASSSVGRFFRLPFSLAIALCIAPAPVTLDTGALPVMVIMVKEALLGAGLGFMVARVFAVVGTAGALIDQQVGYTIGAVFNPNFNSSIGPMEGIYTILLTLVLLGGDNAFGFARTIMATYAAWPIGALYPPMGSVVDFLHTAVTSGAEELIRLALTLAMPIIAMITFADICVAMLARYVPQLNPLSLSLAIKAMLCVLALAFAWPGLPELVARMATTLLRVQ